MPSPPNKKTQNQIIEEFITAHGDEYDYTKVVYKGAHTKVIIICSLHGEFAQSPASHKKGYGCSECGDLKIGRSLAARAGAKFIKEATVKHDNFYNYEKVFYVDCRTAVQIGCPLHGFFEQAPEVHLYGSGCQECGRIKTVQSKIEKSAATIMKRFEDRHGTKYDYSLVEFTGMYNHIKIICPIHGMFEQTPHHHASDNGCPQCGRLSAAENRRYTLEEFIEMSIDKHGNRYLYDKVVYVDIKTNVKIGCPDHGYFDQTPDHHLTGYDCPRCAHRISKPEAKWLNSLGIDGLQFQYRVSLSNYKNIQLDGYDPKTNTAYLFHGDYWHGNPNIYKSNEYNERCKKTFGEIYQRTVQQEKTLIEMGFNLVVMWEDDWKEINKREKVDVKNAL